MKNSAFQSLHINASEDDIAGNEGIGRYIFFPGSDGRAKKIATHFSNLIVKSHSRGHHLYLGTLNHKGLTIDVAAISSGMGCASMEIILHELFQLGGKRFLRIGTAGSLQEQVEIGDIVNATASVRDEQTTSDYMPKEIPALASLDVVFAILQAVKVRRLEDRVHTGLVHCKSSLYAREFSAGPRVVENEQYLRMLTKCGVLASEMETAALFTQTQLYHYQLSQQGKGPQYQVLAGAILGIASRSISMATFKQMDNLEDLITSLGLETTVTLAMHDRAK